MSTTTPPGLPEGFVIPTEFHCSFCGKLQEEVERLIAGPNLVYICNECVALCNTIIAEHETDAVEQQGSGTPQPD